MWFYDTGFRLVVGCSPFVVSRHAKERLWSPTPWKGVNPDKDWRRSAQILTPHPPDELAEFVREHSEHHAPQQEPFGLQEELVHPTLEVVVISRHHFF